MYVEDTDQGLSYLVSRTTGGQLGDSPSSLLPVCRQRLLHISPLIVAAHTIGTHRPHTAGYTPTDGSRQPKVDSLLQTHVSQECSIGVPGSRQIHAKQLAFLPTTRR